MYEDQYLYSRCLIYTFCKAPTDPHQPSISIYLVYLIIFHLLQSFLILFGSFGPIQSIWSILSTSFQFGPIWSYSVHSVLFRPFCPLWFYSIHSVNFSPIQRTSVPFGPLRSYSIHSVNFSAIWSTFVLLGLNQSTLVCSVLLSPFYRLWFYLVYFGPILSVRLTLVHFSPIQPT